MVKFGKKQEEIATEGTEIQEIKGYERQKTHSTVLLILSLCPLWLDFRDSISWARKQPRRYERYER